MYHKCWWGSSAAILGSTNQNLTVQLYLGHTKEELKLFLLTPVLEWARQEWGRSSELKDVSENVSQNRPIFTTL